MKRLLVTWTFIAVLSQGINAGFNRQCTRIPDQPAYLCRRNDSLSGVMVSEMSKLPVNLTGIKSIDPDAFKNLKLEELELYNDGDCADLQISQKAFNNVTVTTLHLRNIAVSDQVNPFKTLKSVKNLNLWNNYFQEFPDNYFADFPQLESLVIGKYENKDFAPISFDLVNEDLRVLKLIDSIQRIFPGSLGRFKNLIQLHILKADMPYLRADMFSGLQSLFNLLLIDCGITRIEKDTFHGLRLHSINLKNNRIGFIGPETFLNLPLSRLMLDGNLLQMLSREIFKTNRNLNFISLGDNKFKYIGTEIFTNLKQLIALNLSNNQIKSIASRAFDGSVMTALDLSNNSIQHLQHDLFYGLSLQGVLYLGGNNITEVESEALKVIQKYGPNLPITLEISNSKPFAGKIPDGWNVRQTLPNL